MIDVHSLTPGRGKLLHRDINSEPVVEVREGEGVRWIHFGDRAVQSAMLLQQPAQIILPYLQCMLSAMVFSPAPSRLLNLGMGGGAFNRFFKACMPTLAIDSVEQDPRMVAIARQYFSVDTSGCYVGSVEQYLAQATSAVTPGATQGASYDLVLCDLYSKAGLPAVLNTEKTYQQLAALMSGPAVLAINLLPGNAQQLTAVLALARAVFRHTALMEVPDFKNIILLASSQPLVERPVSPAVKALLPEMEAFLATMQRLPNKQ